MAEERESGAMIEAAIMYVDPHAKQSQTAFIGKERVLLPYDKDSIHDLRNFKKHIIEYCGLDEQSRERGLGAQFAIKLYRLQRVPRPKPSPLVFRLNNSGSMRATKFWNPDAFCKVSILL